jgi:hypothetical protein
MKKKLPEFLRPYFWDVDFEKLDGEKWPFYVISRIIDRGNSESVRWMINNYSKEEIKKSLLVSRELGRPAAKLWARILFVKESEVPCLRKPYSPIRFGLSS